jgi:hypothetical protein
MNISVTALSHAIHTLSHPKATHPHAPGGPLQPFGQQVTAAMGQGDQQANGTQPQKNAGSKPGALLSQEMLQAMQTVG